MLQKLEKCIFYKLRMHSSGGDVVREGLVVIEKNEEILNGVITGFLSSNGVLINISHIFLYFSQDKNETTPLWQ